MEGGAGEVTDGSAVGALAAGAVHEQRRAVVELDLLGARNGIIAGSSYASQRHFYRDRNRHPYCKGDRGRRGYY